MRTSHMRTRCQVRVHCYEKMMRIYMCAACTSIAMFVCYVYDKSMKMWPNPSHVSTLGHEYVTNENMDRAVHAFRQALLCHPRHYNAWYGLGSIYYRQERFEMAEYHFRQARDINPRSSVLDCYLGMALSAQGGGGGSKVEEALEVLQAASERFEKNPQVTAPLMYFVW